MRDRKNADRRFRFQVDDMVGKPFDRGTTDEQIGWESPDGGSGVGQSGDLVDRGIDSVDELEAEPYAPLLANGPQFRIYAALGNHDWKTSRAGAMAQVKYLSETPPFYMDGIRYRVAPTGDPREVEIFVLDTHVMLSDHSVLDDALTDDGRELDSGKIDTSEPWALPQDADEWGMAQWLE